MLTVVHDGESANDNDGGAGRPLLDEIVRDGARQMLAAALQAEVAAYIDTHLGEVDENGYRLVLRNGYHRPREVITAAGAVPVRAPRVNDKRIDAETGERHRFSSAILPAWVLLGDPAGVGAQVSAGGRGVAAAVLAWPVQQRLRPGVGAVHRVGRGPLTGDDHPADRAVARRRRGVQQALVEEHRLRVRVGRRDRAPRGAV